MSALPFNGRSIFASRTTFKHWTLMGEPVTVVEVLVSALKHMPGNPVDRTDRTKRISDIPGLETSLKVWGQMQPLVISNDLYVIIGNRRTAAHNNIGTKYAPALLVNHPHYECDAMFAEELENQKRHSEYMKLQTWLSNPSQCAKKLAAELMGAQEMLLCGRRRLEQLAKVRGTIYHYRNATKVAKFVGIFTRGYVTKAFDFILDHDGRAIASIRYVLEKMAGTHAEKASVLMKAIETGIVPTYPSKRVIKAVAKAVATVNCK